ncbi:MAG: hypothetical protein JWO48_3441, partial [Bryobacterales bacterium]|nr:hypothetical protein [Bryobacterales bacterium]
MLLKTTEPLESYPKDFAALRTLALQAAQGARTVVMQAGHFLLFSDETTGEILPCLEEYMAAPHNAARREDYAQFPILTWRLGLRLLESLSAPDKRVMVVVNDWQYVAPDSDRAEFYANHKRLPDSYIAELKRYASTITLFEPANRKRNSTYPFFGESNLRNRYKRHVEKLIRHNRLPVQAIRDSKDGIAVCSLPNPHGQIEEIYCSSGTGDCAGEIAEMIYDANERAGATCFINLYPVVCKAYAVRGSRLAVDL